MNVDKNRKLKKEVACLETTNESRISITLFLLLLLLLLLSEIGVFADPANITTLVCVYIYVIQQFSMNFCTNTP